jgi:predicted nucleic acid-binding protein
MSVDFLDSNVFVYLFDETSPTKQRIAEALIRSGLESGDAAISFQVVQETLSVMTRKFVATASPEEARRFLERVLFPLWAVMPSEGLYERALELRGRYGFSFYDALIVAAALAAGCRRLYSEDFQDGQKIEQLTVVNPFAD